LNCLGNADGIGDIRSEELFRSASFFGIDSSLVQIINNSSLQDGFNKQWSPSLVSSIVESSIRNFTPDMVR
jgi:hypothetical protein